MNLQVPRSGQVFDPSLDPPPMWRKAKPLRGLAFVKSCIQAVIQIPLDIVAVGDFGMNRKDAIFTDARRSNRSVLRSIFQSSPPYFGYLGNKGSSHSRVADVVLSLLKTEERGLLSIWTEFGGNAFREVFDDWRSL